MMGPDTALRGGAYLLRAGPEGEGGACWHRKASRDGEDEDDEDDPIVRECCCCLTKGNGSASPARMWSCGGLATPPPFPFPYLLPLSCNSSSSSATSVSLSLSVAHTLPLLCTFHSLPLSLPFCQVLLPHPSLSLSLSPLSLSSFLCSASVPLALHSFPFHFCGFEFFEFWFRACLYLIRILPLHCTSPELLLLGTVDQFLS